MCNFTTKGKCSDNEMHNLLVLTLLCADFNRHGSLSAGGLSRAHSDQVLRVGLQAGQDCGVLSVTDADDPQRACRKRWILQLVSLDEVRQQRTPAHTHTVRAGLWHGHCRQSLHLWLRRIHWWSRHERGEHLNVWTRFWFSST